MTREEARAWLEVAEHVEEVELRRAYLRKVKAHKPERDPEGFKRTREAYELLQQPEGDRRDVAPRPPGREPSSAEPTPEGVVAVPIVAIEATLREALAQLRTMEAAAERLTHLRALMAEHPSSIPVVCELELELCAGDRYEEAADVLRAAIDRGLVALERILFLRHAPRLTDEELARLEQSAIRDRDLLVTLALIARRRWAEVEARARSGLAASETPVHYLPVVLELFSHERAKSARRVLTALKARVAELGSGMGLRPGDKAYLLLVSELASLRLTRPLLGTLARDVRRGTFHETRAYLVDVEYRECVIALNLIYEHAPMIGRLIGRLRLAAPQAEVFPELIAEDHGFERLIFKGLGAAGVAVAALFVVMLAFGDVHVRVSSSLLAPAATVRLVDGEPEVGCEGDGGCAAALEISRALDANDCARALARLETFERLHTERMERFVVALRARAFTRCPE